MALLSQGKEQSRHTSLGFIIALPTVKGMRGFPRSSVRMVRHDPGISHHADVSVSDISVPASGYIQDDAAALWTGELFERWRLREV